MEITREIAVKVRDVVAAGLVSGMGEQKPGEMCVEAAVCYALGLPHGDDPGCVSQPLRQLKMRLNDAQWSSPKARADGLRRLALAQLGSAGVLDDAEFVRCVAEMTIRKAVPIVLRAAAKRNAKHADALEAAAVRCEQEGTRQAAKHAADAAIAADAAAYAVYVAADAAAAATYADATAADARASGVARDSVLADYAEWVVQILIDMKAPGCQWLDLVEV
jgi:hypothetical protein